MKKLGIALHAFWIIMTNGRHILQTDRIRSLNVSKSDIAESISKLEKVWDPLDDEVVRIEYFENRIIR